MQRAKNLLTETALLTLYYSMIHCHLNYGINIWSCASLTNIKPLVTKQKYAIRVITKSKFNTHTEPLFKKCSVLPITQLIEYSKLLFMHNYTQQRLPSCFNNTWVTNQERRMNEERTLRNEDDYFIQLARTKTTERLPAYTMPNLWNNLQDTNIKNEQSLARFKRRMKSNLLNNLASQIICNRTNCPTCSALV